MRKTPAALIFALILILISSILASCGSEKLFEGGVWQANGEANGFPSHIVFFSGGAGTADGRPMAWNANNGTLTLEIERSYGYRYVCKFILTYTYSLSGDGAWLRLTDGKASAVYFRSE